MLPVTSVIVHHLCSTESFVCRFTSFALSRSLPHPFLFALGRFHIHNLYISSHADTHLKYDHSIRSLLLGLSPANAEVSTMYVSLLSQFN